MSTADMEPWHNRRRGLNDFWFHVLVIALDVLVVAILVVLAIIVHW